MTSDKMVGLIVFGILVVIVAFLASLAYIFDYLDRSNQRKHDETMVQLRARSEEEE